MLNTAPWRISDRGSLKTARRRKRTSKGLDHRVIRKSSFSEVKPMKMTSVGSGRHEGVEDKIVEVGAKVKKTKVKRTKMKSYWSKLASTVWA